jgi:hypothetical protein
MITPILKDPKKHGGTLYTFPSASRDLTRAFSNSEYEFAFSHFACLNLPYFRYGDFVNGDEKGIYLDNLCKHYYTNSGLVADSDSESLSAIAFNKMNTCLKWHMQSYIMNYEVAILNGFSLDSGQYDSEILRTPSERIFFNWLQKVGAIKFSGKNETLSGYGHADSKGGYETLDDVSKLDTADKTKNYRIGNKLYMWKGGEWRSQVLVSKTVQYIGTIDMINNVNIDYDSFNEIYLNIPAGVGGSTNVYFDYNVFDKNYEKGEIINVADDKYCDDEDEIKFNKYGIACVDDCLIDKEGNKLPDTELNCEDDCCELNRYYTFAFLNEEQCASIEKCGTAENILLDIYDTKLRKVVAKGVPECVLSLTAFDGDNEVVLAAINLANQYDNIRLDGKGTIIAKKNDIITVFDYYQS